MVEITLEEGKTVKVTSPRVVSLGNILVSVELIELGTSTTFEIDILQAIFWIKNWLNEYPDQTENEAIKALLKSKLLALYNRFSDGSDFAKKLETL